MAWDCKSKSFQIKQSKEEEKLPQESSCHAEVNMAVDTKHGEQWCLDSKASTHMCSRKEKFHKIEAPKSQVLNLANNDSMKIEESGIVKLNTNEGVTAKLEETLFVPNLRSNLLSVSKMTKHQIGFKVMFRKNKAIITNPKTNKTVITAHRKKDLYFVTKEMATLKCHHCKNGTSASNISTRKI